MNQQLWSALFLQLQKKLHVYASLANQLKPHCRRLTKTLFKIMTAQMNYKIGNHNDASTQKLPSWLQDTHPKTVPCALSLPIIKRGASNKAHTFTPFEQQVVQILSYNPSVASHSPPLDHTQVVFLIKRIIDRGHQQQIIIEVVWS